MKLLDIVIKEDFRTQYMKFTEKEGVDPTIVKSYLSTFKKLKDKYPKQLEGARIDLAIQPEKRKDIDSYKSFKDLELIVDYLRGQVDIEEDEPVEVTGDYTVYEDDNLKISRGVSPQSCVKIRGKETPSWCVARSDKHSNLYNTYRLKPGDPTFYFVRNKNKRRQDSKYYFFVVQVLNDGTYTVTSAENDGDIRMSWEQIVKIEPLLTEHKDLFRNYKVTSDERASAGFKDLGDEEYSKLTYRHKKLYIDGKFPLNYNKLLSTPMDLITYYINSGGILTSEQERYLTTNNPKLLNRYHELIKRRIGENAFLIALYKYDMGDKEVDLKQFTGEIVIGVDTNSYYRKQIYLNLERNGKRDMLSEADISEDGLSYLEGVASRYHSRDVDESELDYMWRAFDPEVEKEMIKLLKVMGVPSSKLDKLDNEGVLRKILNQFEFGEKIMEEYIMQYSYLVENAETEEAGVMLEKYNALPFEFSRTNEITIGDIGAFIAKIVDVDPSIANFETAIIELLKTTELDGDLYNIEYYGREDYGELNREMLKTIENIYDDLSGDYSEYYNKIVNVIEKLGFEDDKLENDLVSIEILDRLPLDLDDEDQLKDPTITIKLINKKTGKEETGNVLLSSLPNYVNNYQLFDEVKRFKELFTLYL